MRQNMKIISKALKNQFAEFRGHQVLQRGYRLKGVLEAFALPPGQFLRVDERSLSAVDDMVHLGY